MQRTMLCPLLTPFRAEALDPRRLRMAASKGREGVIWRILGVAWETLLSRLQIWDHVAVPQVPQVPCGTGGVRRRPGIGRQCERRHRRTVRAGV